MEDKSIIIEGPVLNKSVPDRADPDEKELPEFLNVRKLVSVGDEPT